MLQKTKEASPETTSKMQGPALAQVSYYTLAALPVAVGHSLGGALAILAAYDIKSTFRFQRLSVHTFGAPRPGNHAFARYASCLTVVLLPTVWQLLCSQVTWLPRSPETHLYCWSLHCTSGVCTGCLQGLYCRSPETGHHHTAIPCRDYNSMCPKTWQVIMSCDIVPQMGKFGRMYKHPGHRVILDKRGSILVRPTPLELHLRPGIPTPAPL